MKKSSEDRVTVTEGQLSGEQKEAFEAAFLEKDATVRWQGETYTIVMMDQDYPDQHSEHITVSFQLERVVGQKGE